MSKPAKQSRLSRMGGNSASSGKRRTALPKARSAGETSELLTAIQCPICELRHTRLSHVYEGKYWCAYCNHHWGITWS